MLPARLRVCFFSPSHLTEHLRTRTAADREPECGNYLYGTSVVRHESCARIAALGRTEGDLPVPGGARLEEDRRVGPIVRQAVQEQERGAAVQRGVPHSGPKAGLQERQGCRRARPTLRARRSGGKRLCVAQGTVPLQSGGCGSERQGDEPLESDSLRVTDK